MATRSKLAVILHADVVGSTALVRKDESLAHDRIQAAFQLFTQALQRYGGTVHEIRGDALVAEFSRASDAVIAALAATRVMPAASASGRFSRLMPPIAKAGRRISVATARNSSTPGNCWNCLVSEGNVGPTPR